MHLGFTPPAQPLGNASQQQEVCGKHWLWNTGASTPFSCSPGLQGKAWLGQGCAETTRKKGNFLSDSSVRVLGRAVRVTGALRVLINSGHLPKCSMTTDLLGGSLELCCCCCCCCRESTSQIPCADASRGSSAPGRVWGTHQAATSAPCHTCGPPKLRFTELNPALGSKSAW